jgi:hypothetical protein
MIANYSKHQLQGPEIVTSSFDWAQLNGLLREDRDSVQFSETLFPNKENMTMDNVQKVNNCIKFLFMSVIHYKKTYGCGDNETTVFD